jgi:phosphoglycolate phosphatase-like HAD superfamily hydrolase
VSDVDPDRPLQLVLDMDGVLFDSDEIKAVNLVASLVQVLDPAVLGEVDRWNRTQRGVPRRDKFEYIAARWLSSPPQAAVDALEQAYSLRLRAALARATALPGAEMLRACPAGLHLCSSAPIDEIGRLLDAQGLADVFESVEGDPPGKRIALALIVERHPRDLVVMIGDGDADLDAASATGAAFIGVDRGVGAFAGRDVVVVESLAQALTHLGV